MVLSGNFKDFEMLVKKYGDMKIIEILKLEKGN